MAETVRPSPNMTKTLAVTGKDDTDGPRLCDMMSSAMLHAKLILRCDKRGS